MRIKRRNLIWLSILGLLAGVGILSQGLDSSTTLLLLATLGTAGGIALFDLEPRQLLKTVQERTALGSKVTAEAREATERAEARGARLVGEMELLDVGLITLSESYDGMVMNRTRSLSLDDNSARPYITLQVPTIEADRRATVRFEIEDGYGDKIYVREQEVYLRDGKMDILAETQMPLFDSDMNIDTGDGDLRVYIDGDLAGILGFTLSPSTRDRWAGRRAARTEQAGQRLADRERDEEEPISLEDLLRQSSRR